MNVIFASIIIILIMFIIIRIFFLCWNYLNRRRFDWNTQNGKCWAVVTGATDGMGYEFARQLALKGYNLMIISGDPAAQLQEKKQLIQRECPFVQIRIMIVDFRRSNIWDNIRKFINIDTNNVFILVNNCNNFPDNVDEFEDDDNETSTTTTTTTYHRDLINANIMSTIRMTELVLPSMVMNRNGLIINITSITSLHNGPAISYGSTKVNISII